MIETLKEVRDALEDLKRQYGEHPDAFWDWTKARAAITKLDALIAEMELAAYQAKRKMESEEYMAMLNKWLPVVGALAQIESKDADEKCTDERMCVACFTAQGDCLTAPQPAPSTSEPLTDEQIGLLTTGDGWAHLETPALALFARAIEAKIGAKP